METEKGKTYKYLREQREISQSAKDKMKQFSKIKKTILDELRESDLTIDQLAKKMDIPKDKVVFYLMSLIKYGLVEKGEMDDMDEFFTYKLKK
jgi:predicted ArsR family transcriptional regulator